MSFSFDEDTYRVHYGDTDLTLLPKEFALLRFLEQHPNRIWSRDELLNFVWSDEAPVDRTVDDHVYRLRKKLKILAAHGPTIETVRGRGYRYIDSSLDVHTQVRRIPENQLVGDPNYRDHIRALFEQYVLFGYGDGLKTLRQNSEVFGLSEDRLLLLLSRFMAGDFGAVVHDEELPFADKSLFLIGLFTIIHPDSDLSLEYWRRALDKSLIPEHHVLEVECFELPALYMRLGRLEEAKRAVSHAVELSESMDMEGFRPLVRLYDVLLSLYERKAEEAETKLQIVGDLLKEYNWKREEGYFNIIRGFWLLEKNDAPQAEHFIDRGLATLYDSGFLNHVVLRLRDIIEFFDHVQLDERLRIKYRKSWTELAIQHDFSSLQAELQNIFAKLL